MASIVPGYEYDIFISYRQKDNKYDGWVTEFVDNLKRELEATFKEEISVYFDIHPHDGLLETHDVDASLKDKLKCLVFIPIVSRTYCDPKSFAWEHELKAFVEQASHDQFGLKVKLPNGNVASRVLPIRIYDLDSADAKLCESVHGGMLRGVEFIYAEPGVNRPLKPDDDEKINLNKTRYRNQINKVGNAIKEVISGLKTGPVELGTEKIQHGELSEKVKKEERIKIHEKPAKVSKKKLLSGIIIIAVLLAIGAILAYPKLFKRGTIEKLRSSGERISVAVMPFQNMTNDTTLNIWQDGIQNEIINSLTNSGELKVRQTESTTGLLRGKGITNYASITPFVARTISQKLDANVFIYGSIKQVGSSIRINAQLIDSKTEEIFKSFQIDGNVTKILPVIDSLSKMVKDCLIVSNLRKKQPRDLQQFFSSTNSADAYRYFIYGNKAFSNSDLTTAASWYMQSIKCDSSYIPAAVWLSAVYLNLGLFEQGKKLCLRNYQKRDQLPIRQRIWANLTYAGYFQTTSELIKWINQLIEIDDQQPLLYYNFGDRSN
jgi:TolB-like protein